MERRRNLLESIGSEGRSLVELARVSGMSSVDVAVALQGLRLSGLVETDDGLWKRSSVRDCHDVVVVVDLGNVHDCLQKLAPLAEAGEVQVRAYADLQYNGYGVNPPPLRTKTRRTPRSFGTSLASVRSPSSLCTSWW